MTAPNGAVDGKVDILIVDDNEKNLLALEAMLADLGQNVVRAHSGKEALRRLLEKDYALTLLDIQMPELDGFQTAELIRARERSRAMPIIFLTAFNRSEDQIAQAYSLGAVDFLFKPIVPTILRAKVSAFVELFRKTEEIKRQAMLLRDIEKREHERRLAEAAQRWESERLREEMVRERQNAETLARIVAERERAEVALQRSNRRLKLLAEMANRLLLGARPEEFLSGLYNDLSEHLHLEVYTNYLLADDGHTLRLTAYGGVSERAAEALREASDESVAREVVYERRPRVTENVQADTSEALAHVRALGIQAYACFPLIAQDRVLGALAFGTRDRAAFDSDVISVMRVVCDQVAMALERTRLIDELSRRNRALADVDRRKDEFLAMLAHELRNPLAPIVNAVHVLRLPSSKPEVDARARDAIERQVRHMVRLVDDLLDLSRITTGKVELRREMVSLRAVIEHAVQTSLPLIQRQQHALDVSLPPEDVTFYADPTRLGQVVSNLLNNSARYSPPGGHIRLACARDGDEVVISVRDRGIGIPPEMLSQVFDLFVQTDRRADRSQGGLGIGLTLARSLVEMHGGAITAQSEGLNRGAEFTVRLPLNLPEKARTVPPPPTAPTPVTGGLRLVLVEDNDDVRETLGDYLRLCGHTVEVAEDGRGGVDLVLGTMPDVAFIDIGLPSMDGYEVAAEIRARAPGAPVRLIALTGYGRPEDRKRALDAGFNAHLVKPVAPEDLDQIARTPS